jgi:hypothetical protein
VLKNTENRHRRCRCPRFGFSVHRTTPNTSHLHTEALACTAYPCLLPFARTCTAYPCLLPLARTCTGALTARPHLQVLLQLAHTPPLSCTLAARSRTTRSPTRRVAAWLSGCAERSPHLRHAAGHLRHTREICNFTILKTRFCQITIP